MIPRVSFPTGRALRLSASRYGGLCKYTRNLHTSPEPARSGQIHWLGYGVVLGTVAFGTSKLVSSTIYNDSNQKPDQRPVADLVPAGLKDEVPLREFGTVYDIVPGLRKDMNMREKMEALLKFYQKDIIAAIEHADSSGKTFIVDEWSRGEGKGGGITRVFQDGQVFEKGGVNFSAIYGTLPPAAAQRMRANHKELKIPENGQLPFYACGLSLVIHPKHYLAPSVHMNYRYFETQNEDGTPQAWWFGGGQDLSPMYFDLDDSIHFHKLLKEACDKHDTGFYPRFKKWADDYFLIKFRGEARGIGGIFFDDLNDRDAEELFLFVSDAISRFVPSYLPAVKKAYEPSGKPRPTEEEGQHWQGLRRGRYVEFNLAVDRGTSFGLQTPGSRVESILMTLPKQASWEYNYHPAPGSLEAKTVEVLKNPIDYV